MKLYPFAWLVIVVGCGTYKKATSSDPGPLRYESEYSPLTDLNQYAAGIFVLSKSHAASPDVWMLIFTDCEGEACRPDSVALAFESYGDEWRFLHAHGVHINTPHRSYQDEGDYAGEVNIDPYDGRLREQVVALMGARAYRDLVAGGDWAIRLGRYDYAIADSLLGPARALATALR